MAKNLLQEYTQKNRESLPVYESRVSVVAHSFAAIGLTCFFPQSLPSGTFVSTVSAAGLIAVGDACYKKVEAEQSAATKLLQLLTGNSFECPIPPKKQADREFVLKRPTFYQLPPQDRRVNRHYQYRQ